MGLTNRAPLAALVTLGACYSPGSFVDLDPNGENHWTPLHETAILGQRGPAESLIAQGAEINARARFDMTPLHWAALAGHLEVIRLLCDAGADLDAPNLYGMTALHEAATPEVAMELLSAGAKLEAKDRRGMTPLHLARSAEGAEVLINAGANITIAARDGRTPIQMMSPLVDAIDDRPPRILVLPTRGMVRLRDDHSRGRVEVRNISTQPLTNLRLAVHPDDNACSATTTPLAIERLNPAQRAGFDIAFTRTPGVKPGQRAIGFAISAELAGEETTLVGYSIQLDTRRERTPTDRGLVPLAQVQLRATPTRHNLLAFLAAPLVLGLLFLWLRARRPAPVPEGQTAGQEKDDDEGHGEG